MHVLEMLPEEQRPFFAYYLRQSGNRVRIRETYELGYTTFPVEVAMSGMAGCQLAVFLSEPDARYFCARHGLTVVETHEGKPY